MGGHQLGVLLKTKRLIVRTAEIKDAQLIMRLWKKPELRTFTDYPISPLISKDAIVKRLLSASGSEFEKDLIVVLKHEQIAIGQCYISVYGKKAEVEINILPKYGNNKFELELQRQLLNYIFLHTNCEIVETKPNIKNIPLLKMEKSIGSFLIKKGNYYFPQWMINTPPIRYCVFQIHKEEWLSRKASKEEFKDLSPDKYMDPTHIIPGWPGYRTNPNRIGLDPMATYADEGHAEGLFIKHLITFKLITNNLLYLFFMGIISLFFSFFSFVYLREIFVNGNLLLIINFPYFVAPVFLLINFVKNILQITRRKTRDLSKQKSQ